MKLTQKFIKDAAEDIHINGVSYTPAEFFNAFGGTNFKAQLSSANKGLIEIGAPVSIEKFIFLVPKMGWATAYLLKAAF